MVVSYTALRHDADSFINDNGEYTATKIGVTAGAQIGYDWQFGNKVFGVVADANWADVSATSPQAISFAPPFGVVGDQSTSGKMNWFGTLRTRGGVAFNDVLVYGTGGLAVAGIDTTVSSTFVGFPPSASSSARARPAGAGPAAPVRNLPLRTTGA